MWFTCYIGWWLKAGTEQIASRKPLVKLMIWTRRMLALVCLWPLRSANEETKLATSRCWLRLQSSTNTNACAMSFVFLVLLARCGCVRAKSFRVGRTNHNLRRDWKNHLFQVFFEKIFTDRKVLALRVEAFLLTSPVCCVLPSGLLCIQRRIEESWVEERNLSFSMFITRAH